MESTVRDFLRAFVLGSENIETLKAKALDILLENSVSHSTNLVTILVWFSNSKRGVVINRSDYDIISNLLKTREKINAIKHLRTLMGEEPSFDSTTKHWRLGLREAKNTVDNWDFNL